MAKRIEYRNGNLENAKKQEVTGREYWLL